MTQKKQQMKQKKNHNLNLRISYFFYILFCLNNLSYAQFSDTTTNVYQDKDLTKWTEGYIVKAGFLKKTVKGYQVPLFNGYYKDLKGHYSIHIIEKQDFDTLSVVLYRIHAGTENDRPLIIKRIITKNEKSSFQAIGRKRDLESLFKIHLLFKEFSKFSPGTQLFCYRLLLDNYEWSMKGYEE